MGNPAIVAIEWAQLEGRRPRPAGSNARLGPHGSVVRVPLLRLTAADGACGFGACYAAPERASELLGLPLDQLFAADQGVLPPYLPFEYAIWDLAGQRLGQPVYALAAAVAGVPVPMQLRAPCYDTSLYFDDLRLPTDAAAADLLAAEAGEGYARGHRAFKLKVGRGARHLPLVEGTRRDIAVIQAVRAALGPSCALLLDANNGYNLNLAKQVLAETADCRIGWLEEPFHEDDVLYRDLHDWLARQHLPVRLADGEGQADPRLLEWARAGLVDVLQFDIFDYGFTRWLALGRELQGSRIDIAPHHYGTGYGNFAACHLAGAVPGFAYVEWDAATIVGIDDSGYVIDEGWVSVPATPGFGITLDEGMFQHALARTGGKRTLAP